VRVGRPRVGALDTGAEVAERPRHVRPHAEGAVDVEPRARLLGCVGDRRQRIERAGVDVPELRADDRRSAAGSERTAKRLDLHASLVVRRHRHDARRAHPQEPQRTIDRHVPLLAGEDADPRRAGEPVAPDVPAGVVQHLPARRRERGHVRELAAGHESGRDALGQAEQVAQPVDRHLLRDRGRGTGGVEPRVLIPDRREPVRCGGGGNAAADHEAEEAPARHADDAGIRGGGELGDDLLRIERPLGERPAERRPELVRSRLRLDRPCRERLDEVGGVGGRPFEQPARAHRASVSRTIRANEPPPITRSARPPARSRSSRSEVTSQ
jgi:hypothetical protein